MKKLYNCATLPAELRSKQQIAWKVSGALAELVDNSFGRKRGNADSVTISYDAKARILTVLDNGQGMDHIGRLFQGGNSIGHSAGDIGEFGAGGSLAILWLASAVEVWTLRGDGKVMFDRVIWKDWIKASSFEKLGVSDEWVAARLSNTPPELLSLKRGTFIRLHLLQGRKLDAAKIVDELSKLYSPGLRGGRKLVWQSMRGNQVTDTRTLVDPFAAPSATAETVDFNIVVDHVSEGVVRQLPVRGRVHYDDATSQADSRVQLGYAYRTIRSTNECFRSPDGSEKYPGVGISGWLDLGEPWRAFLSTTKDKIDDEPLKDALMGYVFKQIRPLLEKSKQKVYSVLFDDLALGLEQALNRRGGDTIVKVKPQKGGVGGGVEEGGEEPTPVKPVKATDQPQGEHERHAPPRLRIQLVPTDDTRMGGHLCKAELIGNTDTMVYINKDHFVVEQALQVKPINRLLLHQLIVDELANTVATDEPFIEALFKPGVARQIIDIDDHRDRARTLTRQLIDRVNKPGEDEAA